MTGHPGYDMNEPSFIIIIVKSQFQMLVGVDTACVEFIRFLKKKIYSRMTVLDLISLARFAIYCINIIMSYNSICEID